MITDRRYRTLPSRTLKPGLATGWLSPGTMEREVAGVFEMRVDGAL
jgi:hypothetical protein